MTTILVFALVAVSLVALGLAGFVGSKWLDVARAWKSFDRAVGELNAERKCRVHQEDKARQAVDLLVKSEKSRAESLSREGKQLAEIQALTLQVETIQKEAQQFTRTMLILQEESNKRIDELTADVEQYRGTCFKRNEQIETLTAERDDAARRLEILKNYVAAA